MGGSRLLAVALLISVLGLVPAVSGFILLFRQLKRRKQWTSVKGKIARIDCIKRFRNNAPYESYVPVFSYELNGEVFEKSAEIGSSFQQFSGGDFVSVLVDPLNPNEAVLDESNEVTAPFLLIVLGLIIIVADVFIFICKRN